MANRFDMEEMDASKGITWSPPGAKIRGRLTGIKHPLCFYLDDEDLQNRLALFFNDGTVRASVARLLECVRIWQERYGNDQG